MRILPISINQSLARKTTLLDNNDLKVHHISHRFAFHHVNYGDELLNRKVKKKRKKSQKKVLAFATFVPAQVSKRCAKRLPLFDD